MRTIQLSEAGGDTSLNRPKFMKIVPPPQGLEWRLMLETRSGEEVTVLSTSLTQLTAFSSHILVAKD